MREQLDGRWDLFVTTDRKYLNYVSGSVNIAINLKLRKTIRLSNIRLAVQKMMGARQ